MMDKTAIVVAVVIWALIFAAGLVGMRIGSRLPASHRASESKDTVLAVTAIVSTLTALVLGLLLSVAHTSFQNNQEQLMSTSSELIRLDHMLRLYGPDADDVRRSAREYALSMKHDVFPPDDSQYNIENEATLDLIANSEIKVGLLTPTNANQRLIQPHILLVTDEIIQGHFELVKQRLHLLPHEVILLLVVWLILLFGVYGLYTPKHLTSLIVFMLASGAASAAILLIIELETPHHGFVTISGAPLQHAIDFIDLKPTLQ
jgi:hypothetical protein